MAYHDDDWGSKNANTTTQPSLLFIFTKLFFLFPPPEVRSSVLVLSFTAFPCPPAECYSAILLLVSRSVVPGPMSCSLSRCRLPSPGPLPSLSAFFPIFSTFNMFGARRVSSFLWTSSHDSFYFLFLLIDLTFLLSPTVHIVSICLVD